MKQIQNYINHIVFVVDASGSMDGLTNKVVEVFDGQIAHLAKRSKELNQETRVSVYIFGSDVRCIIYDMDVMRLPSLRGHNIDGGGTRLIDATVQAIQELQMTPELYADHAFLVYVLTDGGENQSRKYTPAKLKELTEKLQINWTFACLVPNEYGRDAAVRYGFPQDNTQVWSTNIQGLEQVGANMKQATENFMQARAKGVRSTRALFTLDTSKLNSSGIKQNLVPLNESEYKLIPVKKDEDIRGLVEKNTSQPYVKGKAFYQLTKAVKVQNHKTLCVQDKSTGKVYTGQNARTVVGLPDYEVTVSPVKHDKFNIFIQSTSVNRKLLSGTKVLVLK